MKIFVYFISDSVSYSHTFINFSIIYIFRLYNMNNWLMGLRSGLDFRADLGLCVSMFSAWGSSSFLPQTDPHTRYVYVT